MMRTITEPTNTKKDFFGILLLLRYCEHTGAEESCTYGMKIWCVKTGTCHPGWLLKAQSFQQRCLIAHRRLMFLVAEC
jgi:hypothetical protein